MGILRFPCSNPVSKAYRPRMPTSHTLLLFALAALALILVPGPGILLLLARGVAFGKRAAVFSSLGLETGTGVCVVATATGLGAVLASLTVAFSFVRYVGAGYLVLLGLRTLVSRTREKVDPTSSPPTSSGLVPGRAYRQALLVGITSP